MSSLECRGNIISSLDIYMVLIVAFAYRSCELKGTQWKSGADAQR